MQVNASMQVAIMIVKISGCTSLHVCSRYIVVGKAVFTSSKSIHYYKSDSVHYIIV